MKTRYFLSIKSRLYFWIYIFKNINESASAFCILNHPPNTLHKGSTGWTKKEMYYLNAESITYKQARKILGTKNLNKALAIVKGLQ